jgi:hypothetical protein
MRPSARLEQRGARPRRLRTHLVLLTLLSLLPAVAVTAAAMFLALQQERAKTQAALERQTAAMASSVNAELQRTIGALGVLGSATVIRRGDYAGFHELAQRVVAADAQWDNVLLIGSRGEQLANARVSYGTPLPDLTRPELPLKALVSGEPVISDVSAGAVAKKMLTAVYVPVRSGGTVSYVLAAGIEPQTWEKALRRELPGGAAAMLLDRFSFVVATAQGTDPPSAGLLRQQPGELAQDHAGPDFAGRYFVSSHPVATGGWRVVSFLPRERAGASLLQPLTYLGVGMLTLAACSLLLSLLLARRLARALDALEQAAAQPGSALATPFTEVNACGERIAARRP